MLQIWMINKIDLFNFISILITIDDIKLIGICGKKRSGKDTVADYLCLNYNFTKDSFAKPLKIMCKELFSFSDDQIDGDLKEVIDEYWKITPRKTLQFFGTEIMRHKINEICPDIGDSFWINLMNKRHINDQKKLVISDIRFENESKWIKVKGGILININRECTGDTHISENSLKGITYDYSIDNNSDLTFLYKQIDDIMNN